MTRVFNMDCMAFMQSCQDKAFDIAIVDPPYFKGPEKRGYYGAKISRHGVKRIDYPTTETWHVPKQDYFEQLKRIAQNWIIWGFNYYEFCHLGAFKTPRRESIAEFIANNPKGWIIWDKLNGDTSFNDYELAFTSYDRPTVVFTFLWRGMMQGKSIKEGAVMQGNKALNEKKIHPTQKPTALYKWLFMNYVQKGQSVLDTHLGSGSSRIVAHDAGIDFTGIELSPVHFERHQQWFKGHTKQLVLPFC